MKKTIFLILLACLSGWISSCSDSKRKTAIQEAPLISKTLSDGTGRTIRLPRSPQTFISIAPNITEIFYALEADNMLVARSEACNFPPDALTLEAITTWPQLDMEMLKSYDADLILSTDEVFGKEQLALFESADMPVFLQSYQSLEDVFQGIKEIGQLTGREQAAIHLSDSLQALTRHIVDSSQNQIKYGTLVLIGDDPLEVVGGKGLLNELIEKAGGRNVFAEKDIPYYQPDMEEILQTQPEFLLIPSANDQAYANLVARYPALYNTPAEVTRQVFLLDPELLFRPGPRIVEGLMLMTRTLHGKLGREKFVP